MNSRIPALLLILFILSVIVRIPQLSRPLSKHHEFCTAVVLRILSIWDSGGIGQFRFCPVMNYEGKANKWINNHASASGKMVDEHGNFYYVSHPPLAYYLPYAISTLTHVQPGLVFIRTWHLIFHFLCFALVFYVSRKLIPGEKLFPWFAAVFYLFNPATMWFQSNVYMADMFVQTFYIAAVAWCVQQIIMAEKVRLAGVAVLFLLLFAAGFTTWFGVILCISTSVIFLLRGFHSQRYLSIGVSLAGMIAGVLPILLTIWIYSHINGADAYFEEMAGRFLIRTGWFTSLPLIPGKANLIDEAAKTGMNYITSYLPLLLLMGALFIYGFIKRMLTELSIPTPVKWMMVFSISPILVLHIILPDYSGHDFTTLYAALPLSIAAAYLLVKAVPGDNARWFLAVITIVLMIVQFEYINRPGRVSVTGDYYAKQKITGTYAAGLPADEVLFITIDELDPQIIFYASRNMLKIQNDHEARAFLNAHGLRSGYWIKVNDRVFPPEINQTYIRLD